MRLTILGTIAVVFLSAFAVSNLGGCQARYRYPCQDPVNWNKVECNNDACRAEGDCTNHVLGSSFLKREDDPSVPEASPDESLDNPVQKTNSSTETHISSKVETTEHSEPAVDEIGATHDEPALNCTAGVTCTTGETEQPVTLDTVVSTHEHNLAAR